VGDSDWVGLSDWVVVCSSVGSAPGGRATAVVSESVGAGLVAVSCGSFVAVSLGSGSSLGVPVGTGVRVGRVRVGEGVSVRVSGGEAMMLASPEGSETPPSWPQPPAARSIRNGTTAAAARRARVMAAPRVGCSARA
jgi:hypothetical protein